MSVFRKSGRKIYSYDFQYNGRRFSGTTGTTNKRDALEFEKQRRREAAANLIDTRKPLTFHVAALRYWNEVGKHHSNADDTFKYLGWLERNIGKSTNLNSITESTVADLVARRRGEMITLWKTIRKQKNGVVTKKRVKVGEKPISPTTVNRSVLEPLRAILRRASRVWECPVNKIDWANHFLKEPKERIREASASEEETLFNAIRSDYAPVVAFALLTGRRMAEIVNLAWPRVDLFNRTYTVTGKGNKTTTFPLSDVAFALLWDLRGHHPERVFTYVCKHPGLKPENHNQPRKVRGQRYPITKSGLKTMFRRLRSETGIPDLRFHDLRHTFATRLLRSSGNLRLVQLALDHEDIATTSRYAHVNSEDLRAAMNESQDQTSDQSIRLPRLSHQNI